MKNACIDCGTLFPGIGFYVPDELWLQVVDKLGAGEICPWCFNARLAKKDLRAFQVPVHLDLSNFHCVSSEVLKEHEMLAGRIEREKACA